MDRLLYGVAYYDEYMPCDRLDKDVEMIKESRSLSRMENHLDGHWQ